MEHGQLSMVADKFHWVFSEALLNAGGKDVRFGHRERTITPLRLGLALTATWASQRVETIADFPCGFHALFGPTVTSKAFYNQVAKPRFAVSDHRGSNSQLIDFEGVETAPFLRQK